MEIKDIKQRLSIQKVLNHYGLQPNKHNMLNCPFHADDKPSLKIYPNTNTFNCFGCGKNGDQVEFIQQKENCSKHEALTKATELCGGQPADKQGMEVKAHRRAPGYASHTEILTKTFATFQNGLNGGLAKKATLYLQSRILSPGLLEIGYNSGQFHHKGKLSGEDINACIAAGLLIPYQGNIPGANGPTYTPFAKDCIIFPLKNKKGEIVSLYGRSITNTSNSKHYYLKDRQGLYPNYPAPEITKLILTEAIIDAATLLQIKEIKENYEILSLYGTNGLTEEHKQAIRQWSDTVKELQNLKEIIFFFDGDKAGRDAVQKYATELCKDGRTSVSTVETPENEDINSLLQGHEPEILSHLIENRLALSGAEGKLSRPSVRDEPFLLTEETEQVKTDEGPKNGSLEKGKDPSESAQSVQSVSHSSASHFNTQNPDFITFTTNELQIIILGGINLQQLDRLRITLKISRTETNDSLHSIRHTLDLYHSDYLEKFITKASEQLETGTNVLRRAIAELTDQIEHYRLSKIESQKQQKLKLRELNPERSRRAINYLKAKKLMERTNNDIGKTGMIGEENNRLLMYLVFTSRLRDQPLHIISLGGSGTGKTYLQEKISELIPEQEKLEITILSENAFYYFDRKELKNKLVLIEDLDGAQDVLYPLRELQSKKKISKTIPIKDPKGNMKTITLHVEGPISLAGTTTRESLYEDNSNRSLLIYLDGSKEHKELIMDYQRKLSAGKINQTEENQLKEFFKDMQSVLKPITVRNPFAEYLKLPEYIFKPLRTNAHYLATIETVTFYHQYQREVKTDRETGEQYIETTLEDIEWANRLLKEVLLAKADELSGGIRSFFEKLKGWMAANKRESFYKNEIRDAFRMNPNNLKYYLLQLQKYNRIKVVGGNRYKTGLEYEITNSEDYQKLNQVFDNELDKALKEIKKMQ